MPDEKPVDLPSNFEEVLADLLATPPPPKDEDVADEDDKEKRRPPVQPTNETG